MKRLQFIFAMLLQQHRNKAPLKHYQFTDKFNYTDLQDRPTFTVKYLICRVYFKLQVLLDQIFNVSFFNVAVHVNCILNTTVILI